MIENNTGKMKVEIIIKVGIYLRKSRSEEGVQDLAKHKEYLISICEKNGWSYELYEEIDSSQKIDRRELQRLRHDIADGKIDTVMVHSVDRLSRKSRHFDEILEDYFIDQGMTKLYVKDSERNLLDHNTITMLRLEATLSQSEYNYIIKRLKEGRKQSARSGVKSGNLVFGYRFNKETRKVEPHPVEFPILRKICEMTLKNHPIASIVTELNSLGYRSRSGVLWTPSTIRTILDSNVIRGHIIVHWKDGETTVKENNHRACVTEGEWAQIRTILDRRKRNYRNQKTAPRHWLQGILKCPICNHNLPVKNKNNSVVGQYHVKKCRSFIHDGYRNEECGNIGCTMKIIDELIIGELEKIAEKVKKRIEQLKETDIEKLTFETTNKRKKIEQGLRKLNNREEAFLHMLADGTINKETYIFQISKLKDEKCGLQQEINSLPQFDVEQAIKEKIDQFDLLKSFTSLEDSAKRRLFQMLFSKIEYIRYDRNSLPRLKFFIHEEVKSLAD